MSLLNALQHTPPCQNVRRKLQFDTPKTSKPPGSPKSPTRLKTPTEEPANDEIDYILDSHVPQGLPMPLQAPLSIPGWVTPPHLRPKRRLPPLPIVPPQLLPQPQLWQELARAENVSHRLQLQLQTAPQEQFLDQQSTDFLIDDADLTPQTPPRPCTTCHMITPPSPPSPPTRTPSPTAADILQGAGVQFSPRSRSIARGGTRFMEMDDSGFYHPGWLDAQSPLEYLPDSPDRVVTQGSAQRRYVVTSPIQRLFDDSSLN